MSTHDYFRKTVEEQARFFASGAGAVLPCFSSHIEVEVSSYCNLACPFCYTSELSRKRGRLPIRHFRRLLDYLETNGYKPRISFSGDGETFTHKRLVDFVAYAKAKGHHVQIITNGILCTPDKAAALIGLGLDRIQFSIDSVCPETYAQMRPAKSKARTRRNFATVMANVLEYARLNYEAGGPTSVSIMAVQTDANRREAGAFEAFWHALPIDSVYLSPLYTLAGNAAKINAEAAKEAYRGPSGKKPVCVCPFVLLCIKSDGKVLLCSHDSDAVYPIGNIIENGEKHDVAPNGDVVDRTIEIDSLWNNARARRLRAALLARDTDAFRGLGLDCAGCNAPLGDGNIEAYKTGLDSPKVRRIWESMNKTPGNGRYGEAKYEHLLAIHGQYVVPAGTEG